MKGRDMRSNVSVRPDESSQGGQKSVWLTERKLRQKFIKITDKIMENHADFIIEVMWDSIRGIPDL